MYSVPAVVRSSQGWYALQGKPTVKLAEGGPSFAETLTESLKQVDDLQKDADQAIEKLVSGESQNVHGAMLAVNKADLAFRMTMQVRNKIVEAYQEVMRMQI